MTAVICGFGGGLSPFGGPQVRADDVNPQVGLVPAGNDKVGDAHPTPQGQPPTCRCSKRAKVVGDAHPTQSVVSAKRLDDSETSQANLRTDSVRAAPSRSVLPLLNSCLVGKWDLFQGSYSDIWADGNFVYLPSFGSPAVVSIVDISNPTNPVLDETLLIPSPNNNASPQDVKVGDGLLFVALEGDFDDSVVIYDVRDPANRQLIAAVRIAGFEAMHNLFYENGFLYLVRGTRVAIVDLTGFDPDNPPASTITTAKWIITNVGTSFIHDVTVKNGRLYVAAWHSGLWIYDVSNVATSMPTFLGSAPGTSTHSMWPTEDGQFVVTGEERGGGGIKVFRITDNGGSLTLTMTDALVSPNPGTFSVHNQLIVGNRLYNSWYDDGLRVLDIDASGLLIDVATFVTGGAGLGNWGVYPFLGEDKILLSDESDGLFIVSLTAEPCPCFPSSPAVADLIDFQPNNKNRFLSVQAGDAGRPQAIRVTAVRLPPPFDVWNGQHWFAGAPIQICENSGQGSTVAPPNCGPAPGLPQRWSWFAPLVCGENAAHFTDWSALGSRCVGGLNDGAVCAADGDCSSGSCGSDPTVHLHHPGIIPSRLMAGGGGLSFPAEYDVQVVDTSCTLSSEASFSESLILTQAAYGDVVSDLSSCPKGPANLNIDVVGDVISVLGKFSDLECAVSKARAMLVPASINFTVGIADVLASLRGFSGVGFPFLPGDPCDGG